MMATHCACCHATPRSHRATCGQTGRMAHIRHGRGSGRERPRCGRLVRPWVIWGIEGPDGSHREQWLSDESVQTLASKRTWSELRGQMCRTPVADQPDVRRRTWRVSKVLTLSAHLRHRIALLADRERQRATLASVHYDSMLSFSSLMFGAPLTLAS
jgi:hypothetical protein